MQKLAEFAVWLADPAQPVCQLGAGLCPAVASGARQPHSPKTCLHACAGSYGFQPAAHSVTTTNCGRILSSAAAIAAGAWSCNRHFIHGPCKAPSRPRGNSASSKHEMARLGLCNVPYWQLTTRAGMVQQRRVSTITGKPRMAKSRAGARRRSVSIITRRLKITPRARGSSTSRNAAWAA